MKGFILTVLLAAMAAFALAGEPPPLLMANPEPGSALGGGGHKGSDAILVDNLVTSGSQYRMGLSSCEYHDTWLAFDYTPPGAVTVRQVTVDYYYKGKRNTNTIYFRLYQGTNPAEAMLVSSWSVPASGYEEKDTGWIMFDKPVYRATIPIPAQNLSGSMKYWFAYKSANKAVVVYSAVQSNVMEDELWWYILSWGPGSVKGAGGRFEISYRLEDAVSIGVEPASLGKIKTLFD